MYILRRQRPLDPTSISLIQAEGPTYPAYLAVVNKFNKKF